MPDADDFQLMQALRDGDPDALAALMRRHQQSLANYFRRLGAYNDVDDLVQDTFLRLYRSREKYRPDARFTTFVYTLARNAWLDSLRRKRTRERVAERVREEPPCPPASVAGSPGARGVDAEHALAGLEGRLREVVVLSVMQGLSYRETANVLGIPVGTVKSRMFEALHELRSRFHE